MKNKIVSFSSKFGVPEKFNSQFHMVKIYIAYAGKNRNGSVISKDTFEKMIPSLYGVPVIGEWKEEKEDFGGHGGKIEISDNGVKYIDTTKPYGYIDSSAAVSWETVADDEGVEKEYLTTTAFLWTSRYPEALKTLNNKNNQSMEINVFDGDVFEEDENYFEITDGEFSALCILGEDVEPCFESAKVSQFNLDKENFKAEFTEMVSELRDSLEFSKVITKDGIAKGGEDVSKDRQEETKFTTYNQKREAIAKALEPKIIRDKNDNIIEESRYWLSDFDEEYAYVSRYYWKNEEYGEDHGRLSYTFDKDTLEAIINDDFEVMVLTWLTKEEHKKLEEDRESFEFIAEEYKKVVNSHKIISEDIVDLEKFKAEKEKEAFEIEQKKMRQAKIDHINTEYTDVPDDMREVFISRVDEYESTEDIDADICVYIVKNKVTFSNKKEKQTNIKVGLDKTESKPIVSPYGDLF